MLFNSLPYLVFLPVVLLVYYRLGHRAQNGWLLVASWFFYGWWDHRFLLLLGTSTVVDYLCGLALATAQSSRKRRALVGVSILTNLSILGFFKYFNFFVDSAVALLQSVGVQASPTVPQILLPMGISFYTFQTMAYTIDVYRGRVFPTRSFTTFALYVSYFPQLVAGPIERPNQLLPQLEAPRRITAGRLADGLILILFGFFKKIAVADAAAPVVDQVFSNPGGFDAWSLLVGVYFFAIQIYGDFSGYTDIARGTSKLLGIDLMENFQHPYFARSIAEFWRRWHVSLSTWLRDYLYIPLGGNRHGSVRTYRNLMLTMLLGGLWHGASWNFVIWGGLHGVFLGLHRLHGDLRTRRHGQRPSPRPPWGSIRSLGGVLLTFHLVCFAWVFFRADTLATSIHFLRGFLIADSSALGIGPWAILRVVPALLLLIVIEVGQTRTGDHTFVRNWPLWRQTALFVAVISCTLVLGSFDGEVPFIYFQF